MVLLVIEITAIALLLAILAAILMKERSSARQEVLHAQIDAYWRGPNRRRYFRLKQSLDATYVLERQPHIQMHGVTADISEGGLRLIIDAKLPMGDVLDLTVVLADTGTRIEVEGTVVWAEDARDYDDPSGKRLFYAGIRFCGMSERDAKALAAYIHANTKEMPKQK